MNILIFDTNFAPGVNRESTIIKITLWQKKRENITIFCSNEGKKFYQKHLSHVTFTTFPHRYSIKGYYGIPFQYIIANVIALTHMAKLRNKFDIIYSLSSTIDFLFIPWLFFYIDRKIKWFVVVDNIVPKPSERPGSYVLKLIPYCSFLVGNVLIKRATSIFVVTNFLKNYYEKRNVSVVKTGSGYGIDTSIFFGAVKPATPHFDALYCGRIHVAKGVFDLVEVMGIVCQSEPTFTLGIMGDGETQTKNKLHAKISEYKLNKNIIFTGYKKGKEKGDIFRNSDLFVFLSYDEGCPQVVIEALAANTKVVTYDLPVYTDVFSQYISSGQLVLVKKGNIKKVSEYISSEKRKKKKFNNHLNDFTWDKIAYNELNSFYEASKKNIS